VNKGKKWVTSERGEGEPANRSIHDDQPIGGKERAESEGIDPIPYKKGKREQEGGGRGSFRTEGIVK